MCCDVRQSNFVTDACDLRANACPIPFRKDAPFAVTLGAQAFQHFIRRVIKRNRSPLLALASYGYLALVFIIGETYLVPLQPGQLAQTQPRMQVEQYQRSQFLPLAGERIEQTPLLVFFENDKASIVRPVQLYALARVGTDVAQPDSH